MSLDWGRVFFLYLKLTIFNVSEKLDLDRQYIFDRNSIQLIPNDKSLCTDFKSVIHFGRMSVDNISAY